MVQTKVVIPYQVRSYQTQEEAFKFRNQLVASRNPLSSQVISNLATQPAGSPALRRGVVIPYQVRSYQTKRSCVRKPRKRSFGRNPLSSQVISNSRAPDRKSPARRSGRNPLSSQVISNSSNAGIPVYRKYLSRNPLSSQVISNGR